MKIAIIGHSGEGQTAATRLALNKCNIPVVVNSEFTDLKKQEPYLITRLPEMPELWIDPNLPKFNENKFNKTRLKNRKKRKKRKRR
tara:strand:+ start:697 stop:954 length:258 start_codon:yes stop_codon:yes gene_type:complete